MQDDSFVNRSLSLSFGSQTNYKALADGKYLLTPSAIGSNLPPHGLAYPPKLDSHWRTILSSARASNDSYLDLHRLSADSSNTVRILGGFFPSSIADSKGLVSDEQRSLRFYPPSNVDIEWQDGRSNVNLLFIILLLGSLVTFAAQFLIESIRGAIESALITSENENE